MNLLNQDNPLHIFLNKVGDIVIVNLLFILCCIPIITIGPALTALYHCTLRSVKGSCDGIAATYFRAFKQNFLQSLLVWIALLAVGFVLIMNIRTFTSHNSFSEKAFFYLSGALFGLLFILATYIFPVISAFANTTKNLLKNSFLFAFMHFPTTILMAVLYLFPIYITYTDLKLFPLYSFCWFFFGFAVIAYLNSMLLYRIFKPYLEETAPSEAPKSDN